MNYLDINDPIINYEQTIHDRIYVDKSRMIDVISSNINMRSSKYICVTRPHPPGAQGEKIWDTQGYAIAKRSTQIC